MSKVLSMFGTASSQCGWTTVLYLCLLDSGKHKHTLYFLPSTLSAQYERASISMFNLPCHWSAHMPLQCWSTDPQQPPSSIWSSAFLAISSCCTVPCLLQALMLSSCSKTQLAPPCSTLLQCLWVWEHLRHPVHCAGTVAESPKKDDSRYCHLPTPHDVSRQGSESQAQIFAPPGRDRAGAQYPGWRAQPC